MPPGSVYSLQRPETNTERRLNRAPSLRPLQQRRRHVFIAGTDKGMEWLESRAATDKHQRLGKSLGVDDEQDARDLVDAAVADGLDVAE